MRRVPGRLTTILALASALTVLPFPASGATGTFVYCGDECRELTDPASDTCVPLEIEAYSGHNGTQSMGYLFHDAKCTEEQGNVNPGDDWRRLESVNGVAFVD
ncbi:MAG: hypothetical protein ACRD0C_18395 [Acidimicrobiia bacterium]